MSTDLGEDDKSIYEKYLEELQREVKENEPELGRVKQYMKKAFPRRRSCIQKDTPSVADVVNFPHCKQQVE